MLKEVEREHADIIWTIAKEVSRYCPGSIKWTARQCVDGEYREGEDDLWGFAIGDGFASLTIKQARMADDVLIRQLATDVMGYPPDSEEDFIRRRNEAIQMYQRVNSEINKLRDQSDYWLRKYVSANAGLARLLKREVEV